MTPLGSWLRALERPGRPADLLFCVIGAVVCTGLAGYFHININLPANLAGDHLFLITSAKSYINGHGFRLDSQLGFPDERDALYFPSFDLSYRVVLWLIAHVVHNPFRAVHLFYMAGLMAMYGFAYWTFRRLGIRAWLAAIGSFASVMTPYLAIRGYGHDTLALSFSAPLGLGLALLIGLDPHDRRLKRLFTDPYVLVAILVVGTSGLYYAFYTVMLVLFAAVAAAMGQRRVSPVMAAVAVSVPIFLILVFSGFGLDLAQAFNPQIAQPRRMPHEQLLYGLNLATGSMAFEFLHKVAKGVTESQAAVPSAFAFEGIAEWPGPFLTLLLFATPLILAAYQLRPRETAAAEDPRLRLIAFSCILILFAMLFAARGGIGYLFNLMVTPVIRADSRIMPFLTIAAILVACTGAELCSASPRIWLRLGGVAVTAALLLVSARPQLWALYKSQLRTLALPENLAARTSYPAMLKIKDRAGLKTVLQLPVASWAESPPLGAFEGYAHQLAYVYDRPGSATRWSYGANERQRWFGLVSFEAADPNRVDRGARLLGFDSVLVAKSAYEGPELAKLQTAIVGQGACRLYEDDSLALYALNGRGC